MEDTEPLENKILAQRREDLKAYINSSIEQGQTQFKPTDGFFNQLDVVLSKDYCDSLGISVSYDNYGGFIMKPLPFKKVEEEDWAKDLEGPKRHWFVVWINKLLYRMNK